MDLNKVKQNTYTVLEKLSYTKQVITRKIQKKTKFQTSFFHFVVFIDVT